MATGINTTQLAYDDRGSGVPVILLHGLTFNRATWAPVVKRLGDGVRTVAIDLPGHGDSRGRPRSLWEVAALVHDLADAIGIERPIVVGRGACTVPPWWSKAGQRAPFAGSHRYQWTGWITGVDVIIAFIAVCETALCFARRHPQFVAKPVDARRLGQV